MKIKNLLLCLLVLGGFMVTRATSQTKDPINDSLLRVIRTTPSDTLRVNAYYKLIQHLCDIDANRAIQYTGLMAALSDSMGYKKGKAQALNAYGNLYLNLGDYRKSLFSFLQALRIYEFTSDTFGMAAITTGLSNVYIRLKNDSLSKKYCLLSIQLYQKTTKKKDMGHAYANLAGIYSASKNFKTALAYYDTALAIATKNQNLYGSCVAWASIAEVYMKMKDYDKAEYFLLKTINGACKNPHIDAAAEETLANTYQERHQWDKAIAHYLRSEQLAVEAGVDYLLPEIYEGLANAYKLKGMLKDALSYYIKYHESKERVISTDKLRQISELQSAYDLEKKDRQIESLDNAKQLAELQSGKDRLYRNSFIIAFLLTLLICIAFIRNAYLKQKMNRILEENNLALNDKNRQIEQQKNKIEKINAELDKYNKQVVKENIIAKYEILKGKTNPHFLFNSLTSLSALILRDKNQALEFIEHFSELYRMILEMGENRLISLRQEMQLVNSYLYLEKARFRNNLNIDVDFDESLNELLLPSFAIQTCVENAIKHNTVSEAQKLKISIVNSGNNIIILNNYQPKNGNIPSTGTGQKNIMERYRLITDITPTFGTTDSLYRVELPLLPSNHNLAI